MPDVQVPLLASLNLFEGDNLGVEARRGAKDAERAECPVNTEYLKGVHFTPGSTQRDFFRMSLKNVSLTMPTPFLCWRGHTHNL